MKLWQKIYIITLSLLILSLNLIGFLFIQSSHNNLLKKEIDSSIIEQKFISYHLKLSLSDFENSSSVSVERFILKIMEKYTTSINYNSAYQILNKNNELIYKDMDFPYSENNPELEVISSNNTNYIIKPINGNYYLFICSLIDNADIPLKVHCAKDISSIYKERHSNWMLFLKLDLFISVLFAIVMLLIIKLLTKPIENLTLLTKEIISGNYSYRINIASKDELGILADNFNFMTETIENNILELQSENKKKEDFINNFTHELKTPLTSIIGYSNFIMTSKYDEEIFFEASRYIYNEARYLEKISFKLMDFIYSKKNNLEMKRINIIDILTDVEKTLSQKLISKNIDLIMTIPNKDLILEYDLIKILFKNLIDNSIKASSENSKIIISEISNPNKFIICVKDFGIGISNEHLDRIFEPFYVVDQSRSRKNNGLGLGLSICQEIIRAHDAELKISSKLNIGTTVFISFNYF